MMGRLDHDQRQLFYSFCLEDAVPQDHLVRAIAGVLDLSWVHAALAPHYPKLGRPSIDPVLMIRMLVVGYVFAIRSERALCRDVQVNLAYRWFCGLSIEDKVPDHSAFSRARNEAKCRTLLASAKTLYTVASWTIPRTVRRPQWSM
jgi:transposase